MTDRFEKLKIRINWKLNEADVNKLFFCVIAKLFLTANNVNNINNNSSNNNNNNRDVIESHQVVLK